MSPCRSLDMCEIHYSFEASENPLHVERRASSDITLKARVVLEEARGWHSLALRLRWASDVSPER